MTARRAAALLALVVAATVSPQQVAAQMFKCVIDKRVVYQQQACPANAEPAASAASDAPSAKSAAGAGSTPRPLKPASRAASSVPAKHR